MKQSTPVILLAAGRSARLGSAKQLLIYQEHSLLQRAIDTAVNSSPGQVFIVLGAYGEEIQRQINTRQSTVIFNDDWEEGIASSVRKGLEAVLQEGKMSQVILMVCDQPFLEPQHLLRLIALAGTSAKGIIASRYQETTGTPVLFKQAYFDDLLNLQGDSGAKKLIERYASDCLTVVFEKGEVDIDTVQDYKKLLTDDHRQV